MTKTTKEKDLHPGKEGYNNNNKASSSSNPWLRLKDPRIVRVSRAFGGKDRHSKVCTVRGLRDRRVRLSVPTAIQLYHLQDRLGLSQPSKVVDWLLDAAKHEIEQLPPLPILPSAQNFSLLMPGRDAAPIATQSSDDHVKNDHELGDNNNSCLGWSNFWTSNSSHLWRERSKEGETTKSDENKENSLSGVNTRKLEEGSDGIVIGNNRNNNMISMNNHRLSFFPGNLPTNGYYPLLMSHLGGGIGFSHGLADLNNNNNLQSLNNFVSLQPSPLSLLTGSQFLSSGSTTSTSSTCTSTTQTYFSNSHNHALEIHDPTILGRQANHSQTLSSNVSAQNLLPNPIMRSLFHFGMSNNSSTYDNSGNSTAQQRSKEPDHQ